MPSRLPSRMKTFFVCYHFTRLCPGSVQAKSRGSYENDLTAPEQ